MLTLLLTLGKSKMKMTNVLSGAQIFLYIVYHDNDTFSEVEHPALMYFISLRMITRQNIAKTHSFGELLILADHGSLKTQLGVNATRKSPR